MSLQAFINFIGEIIDLSIGIAMRKQNRLLAKAWSLIDDTASWFLVDHKYFIIFRFLFSFWGNRSLFSWLRNRKWNLSVLVFSKVVKIEHGLCDILLLVTVGYWISLRNELRYSFRFGLLRDNDRMMCRQGCHVILCQIVLSRVIHLAVHLNILSVSQMINHWDLLERTVSPQLTVIIDPHNLIRFIAQWSVQIRKRKSGHVSIKLEPFNSLGRLSSLWEQKYPSRLEHLLFPLPSLVLDVSLLHDSVQLIC